MILPAADILVDVIKAVAAITLPATVPIEVLAITFSPVIWPTATTVTALTTPRLITLPPVTLPVTLAEACIDMLLAATLPVPPKALLTTRLCKLPTVCKLLLTTLLLSVDPVSSSALLVPPPATLLNKPPSPIKKPAVTLAAVLIPPTADTMPRVVRLPPDTLPAALSTPPVLRFSPTMLPDAVITPGVLRLPPVMLPVTAKLVKVPTVCKLLLITLLLRVLPVICEAGALATTPVSWDPLPKKNPAVVMFPVAVICVLAVKRPCTVAPVPDTTSTLATLAELILTVLLLTI